MSALAVGMQPWMPASVYPTGTIDGAERMAAAWAYNGTSLSPAPPAEASHSLLLQLGGGG